MDALVRRLFPEEADAALVSGIRSGETALFGDLVRRHNRRLFRIARAILRDDSEAEDVLQEAYVRAFEHLGRLEDLSAVATWLSRIVVNEAKARLRRQRAARALACAQTEVRRMPVHDPEQLALARQLQGVLASAIDALPVGCRTVFVLREIEGLDTKEVGAALGIREEAVKTRLHRARAALRRGLFARIGEAALPIFRFEGERCDRLVAKVMRRIAGTKDRST